MMKDYQPSARTAIANGPAPEQDYMSPDAPPAPTEQPQNKQIEDPSATDEFDIDIPAFIRRKMR